MINASRIRRLNQSAYRSGAVLYWMSRDVRVADNWALLAAAQLAEQHGTSLAVAFALSPGFAGATLRHYDALLRGLEETAEKLLQLGISFHLLRGNPAETVPAFVLERGFGLVVCDYSPLRIGRDWRRAVAGLDVPVLEVDAHNIVPAWIASPKLEVGARTLRPKLNRLLPEYLTEFPRLEPRQPAESLPQLPDWPEIRAGLTVDPLPGPVSWFAPGETAAQTALAGFVGERLSQYHLRRNDPATDGQSGLSPYLHYGQLSAQRVALAVESSTALTEAKAAYLEELIVRRELSDNFCHYQPEYDNPSCFAGWATKSLEAHADDERPILYSLEQLEAAETHDPLWNAAQREMTELGKMHGYLRMYWAKKILEWSPSAAEAMARCIVLNDRYELDGRDPNGYAGIAWSIGGVHDRPWFDRPIFGVIRYMNANGAASKFDVPAYIAGVERRIAAERERLQAATSSGDR